MSPPLLLAVALVAASLSACSTLDGMLTRQRPAIEYAPIDLDSHAGTNAQSGAVVRPVATNAAVELRPAISAALHAAESVNAAIPSPWQGPIQSALGMLAMGAAWFVRGAQRRAKDEIAKAETERQLRKRETARADALREAQLLAGRRGAET